MPTGAGVGSAIGFLRAPIAYDVVRSRYQRLSDFDIDAVNAALAEMRAEAYAIVEPAAIGAEFAEQRNAYMRYLGQGHEITVALPARPLEPADVAALQAGFDAAYTRLYGRTIPNLDVEVLSWTLTVKSVVPEPEPVPEAAARPAPAPRGRREVFDSRDREDHGGAGLRPRRPGAGVPDRRPGPDRRGPDHHRGLLILRSRGEFVGVYRADQAVIRAGTVYALQKPWEILTGRSKLTMVMTMVTWRAQ